MGQRLIGLWKRIAIDGDVREPIPTPTISAFQEQHESARRQIVPETAQVLRGVKVSAELKDFINVRQLEVIIDRLGNQNVSNSHSPSVH